MTINPLYSCRVKISRAHQHLRDLEEAIDEYSKRNPNPIITDEVSEPGCKIDRFSIQEPFPADFSSFIGDIAHNLMSALDSLAMALATSVAGDIIENQMARIYFPIQWESDWAKAKAERFFKIVEGQPKIRKLIEDVELHDRHSDRYLYWLNRLNIIDKHRAIIPVAANLLGVEFTFPGQESSPLPIRDKAFSPQFPLQHGDQLAIRCFYEPEYHANAHFRLQVSFGTDQVLSGKPVLETLFEMSKSVEGTVHLFAIDIFGIEQW